MCRRYLSENPKGRILKAVHRQELVQQNSEKIADMTGVDVGIYSAGLGSKRLDSPITCASIQSIARVKDWPYADLLIIDEAHRVPPVKPRRTSQYHTLIAGLRDRNSTLQILGLTATPYRLLDGPLWNPQEGRGEAIFSERVYQIDVPPLVAGGRLAPLRYKSGKLRIDTGQLKRKSTGDFELEQQTDWIVEQIDGLIGDILERGADREKWLIFMPSVPSAEAMYARPQAEKIKASIVTGDTLGRDDVFTDFKEGDTRALVGCEVFTEGFDAPQVDFVVLCRATESTSLYVQIVGRGTRYLDGKKDCLVLDFGENIKRHGLIEEAFDWGIPKGGKRGKGVENPKTKQCRKCFEELPIPQRECPICGYSFALARLSQMGGAQATKGVVHLEVLQGPIVKGHTSGRGRPMIKMEFKVENEEEKQFYIASYGDPDIMWDKHPLAIQWRDRQREILNASGTVSGHSISHIIQSAKHWPQALLITAREPNRAVGRRIHEIIKVEYEK